MGRNAKTLELFDFTDLDTKLVETNYNNAVGYLKIGEIELASQAALRAIKIDADHPPTQALLELIKQEYFVNGLTSIKENKIDEGIHAFQSAVTIDSTFVNAYCEIGRAYLIQGKLDEVEKAAKKVLRLDSASESAHELLDEIKRIYCNRGRAALKRNRLANSKAAVDEVLRLDSDYKPAHKLLKKIKNSFHKQGIAFLGQGQYNKAIVSFEGALAIDPHFTEAYCEIARAYLDQGELASAEDAIGEILELDSGYEPAYTLLTEIKDAYWNFGIECLGQGEFTDAEEAITEVLRLDSSDEFLLKVKDMYCSQALTYLNQEKFEFARKTVEMLLELDSNYEPAYELLGQVKSVYYDRGLNFLDKNLYSEALTTFEKVLELEAGFIAAHYGVIRAYVGQGEFASAKKAIGELLRLDPNSSFLEDIKHAYYERACEYFRRNEFSPAEKAVKEVLRLDSSYELAHEFLEDIKHAYCKRGRMCLTQGKLVDAEKAVEEALRLDLNYKFAHQILKKIKHIYKARGIIFLSERQKEKANSDFQKADAIDGSFTETGLIKAYYQLGYFYFWQNEFERAHVAITEALLLDSSYKPARKLLERLKRIYYDRLCKFLNEDEYDAAITSFESLLAIDPDFTEVKYGDVLTYLAQGDLISAGETVKEILESGLGYYWFDSDHKFASILLKKIKEAYYEQGIALLERNQYDNAIINFKNAIAIDVNFTEAYIGLQDAYLGFGDCNLRQLEVEEKDFDKNRALGQISESIEFLTITAEFMRDVAYLADEIAYSKSCKRNDQNALTYWFRSVAVHSLLTREEEVDLAKRIEAAEAKSLDVLLQVLVKNYLLSPETKVALVEEMKASENKPREALDKLLEELGKNDLLSDGMIRELAERIESGGDDAQKVLVDELLNILVQADTLPDPEKAGLAKRVEIAEAEARRSRDELVQANLRLVISIARKYQGQNIPLEDLIQEGNIGLIKAASKFDYRDGFKFSNYAKQWIKWEIMRALDNSSRLIRLPSYFIKRITEFDAVYATLCQKLQREPYREEIAESLDVTVAQIEEIIMSKVDSVSMDLSLESERSVEMIGDLIDDLIEDSTMSEHGGPIAEMINEDLIVHFFTELPEREQNVLKMRFGLEDGERKTLREISFALGVTRERVRQLEIEAIKRLRMLYNEMEEFQSDHSWAGKTAL